MILVTGAAGFIGSHVCERLLLDGSPVVGLDNFEPNYALAAKRANLALLGARRGFEMVEGDLRDAELMRRLFERYKPRQVVHLAALAGVRRSVAEPARYYDVNVTGTARLLEEASRAGVSRVVFASSSSVYGNTSKVPFRETDRCDKPVSPYGASKRAGELACYAFHLVHGIPTIVLRFFTVYGPRQRPEMAIHLFTRQVLAGQEIPLYGDGTTRRDYTFVGDIVDGVMASLSVDRRFEIINLGSSSPIALKDLVRMVGHATGKTPRVRTLAPQQGDVRDTWADQTRAGKLLGFAPRMRIEDGIAEFVRWYKATGAALAASG